MDGQTNGPTDGRTEGAIWSTTLPLRKPGCAERLGSVPSGWAVLLKGQGTAVWGQTAGWNISPTKTIPMFLFVRIITKLNVLITKIAYAFLLRLEHHKNAVFTPQRARLLAPREGESERVHFNITIKQA